MSRFNSIDDVWDFLNNIPMFQKTGSAASNFDLTNIQAFCDRLGRPQDQFPSIHVAGTNGKGTTCYLLEHIYTSAGYKTGLFTSPHLLRYHERVRTSKKEIPDSAILRFFQKAESIFDEIPLSYFEISTALSFWFFAEQEVDIAIIEAGLGGRLDSTNIINPEVSVITSIGLDHQDILGDTLEEIAKEKAGIIKKRKPVVLGDITGNALLAIESKAQLEQSVIHLSSDLAPNWDQQMVSLKENAVALKTSFHERVNKWNVAMAWKVTEILESKFPMERVTRIQAIECFPGVPARFEKLHVEYDWYFSGSHNVQALTSSMEALEEISPKENWVLVFSALKDKWNPQVADLFQGFKDTWFVEQDGERAISFEEIQQDIDARKWDETDTEIILKELKSELVIFVGSFYFYPIAKRWTTDVS